MSYKLYGLQTLCKEPQCFPDFLGEVHWYAVIIQQHVKNFSPHPICNVTLGLQAIEFRHYTL